MIAVQVILFIAACIAGVVIAGKAKSKDPGKTTPAPLDHKASDRIKTSDILPFLKKVDAKFGFGFDVQALTDMALSSRRDQQREARYDVVYDGQNTLLDFGGYEDGERESFLYFFTDSKDLARALQVEMAWFDLHEEEAPQKLPPAKPESRAPLSSAIEHEASSNFDFPDILPFLKTAERKIGVNLNAEFLANFAVTTPLDQERTTYLEVIYDAGPARVDFRVFVDDINAASLYFFSNSEKLAEALLGEMAAFEPGQFGEDQDSVLDAQPSEGAPVLEIDPRWNQAYYASKGAPLAGSPKAIVWDSSQIRGLFDARPNYDFKPIDHVKALGDLPVWFDFPPETHRPETYEVFWAIDPMGEYLYYLAGHFKMTEKGCFVYDDAQTFFRVETCFEDDVMNVSKQDDVMYQGWADTSGLDAKVFMPRTIGDILSGYGVSADQYDSRIAYIGLGPLLPGDIKGQARMTFNKSANGNYSAISLIFESYRSPANAGEYERMTRIQASSSDAGLNLQNLFDHFKDLVMEYHDMPYVPVSGSMRY